MGFNSAFEGLKYVRTCFTNPLYKHYSILCKWKPQTAYRNNTNS